MKGRREAGIDAILPDGGQIREAVPFFVTVCRIRRWRVEAFTDEQAAIDRLRYTVAGAEEARHPTAR